MMSAFVLSRNSITPRSFKPRSIFQLTIRMESGEKIFQRGTVELPLSISCMAFICVHESCCWLSGLDPRNGNKHRVLHAPTFTACTHIAIGSPSRPVLNRSCTHRSLREYVPRVPLFRQLRDFNN